MATVINNPSKSEDSGVGVIIGVLVAIVLVVLFFVYALPALRGNPAPANNGGLNVDVNLPSGGDNSGGAGGTGGTGGTYTP